MAQRYHNYDFRAGSLEHIRNDLETTSWDWKEVQEDLRSDPNLTVPRFSHYLEISHKQSVYIPRSLAKIAVSILQEMENTYITGMELISEETKISMEYKIPGKQVTIDVKFLRGFEVAIGSGGIHALRIITDTNSTSSQWLGRSDGACTSTRLVLEKNASNAEISALEAAFDVSYCHLLS